MVYVVYRYDRNGKLKGGPYAVRSIRPSGGGDPVQEYLGPAIVEPDGTIISKRTGEILGRLRNLDANCSETYEKFGTGSKTATEM